MEYDMQPEIGNLPCDSTNGNFSDNNFFVEQKSTPLSYSPERSIIDIQPEVQCLETIEKLKRKCEDLKIKLNHDVDYGSQISDSTESKKLKLNEIEQELFASYEVDMIFDHKWINEEGEMFYFVKWKNYTTDTNTWEPESHLTGCKQTIQYYHAMKKSYYSERVRVNKNILHFFVHDLSTRKPYDILCLTKICALCFDASEKDVNSLMLSVTQMKQKVQEILTFSENRLRKIGKKLYSIMKFAEKRKHVLINLNEWEKEINKGMPKEAYVLVENNIDLETAPSHFKFTLDYINNTPFKIPEVPVAFCHCENCFANQNYCCPKDSEGHFAYNKYRRLNLPAGYPIYECNDLCKCSERDCVNRVVQRGQKVKVCIFRTSNDCGWGLKTLESIEKNQFVLEYLGEIITSEEAEARGHIYDYIGRSYLFDLDYGLDGEPCQFTVDAGHVGNAAHFINHSCDPNLHVFPVWINQPDPRLPRLAFFARRKIKRFEELTFDYKMIKKDRFGSLENSFEEEAKRILCKCKSRNCRKYLC